MQRSADAIVQREELYGGLLPEEFLRIVHLLDDRESSVFVFGHTDTSGTEEYNIALSERRAQSAADYLSRLGADPAKMQVVPKGETEPSGLGDDKDRRVELKWR